MPNGNPCATDTEALARELRKPDLRVVENRPVFLIPDGYKAEIHEELLPAPTRKKGTVQLADTESFIQFIKREGSLASCNVYAEADYQLGNVGFTAILNDHEEEGAQWRDYRAEYEPQKSHEWRTWISKDRKAMTQSDFAQFLEENNKDIASAADMPSGAQILAMALNFEAKQEVIIKSAIRMQSGTIAFAYQDNEDSNTLERMEMYRAFALGLAPFFNGHGFQLTARLKYRPAPGGKLSFWYELERPDLVLQQATAGIIETIKKEAGFPLFFGTP